jgi:type IV pilus assembly protein PilM
VANSAPGIDIGTRTITLAEVRDRRGRVAVTNFGGVELPEGAVREGEIIDQAAVSAALKELLGSTKVRNRKAWLGVANQRVVVRQVDLPWVERSELKQSLRYQVQEYVPIPVEEAELDAHVVEEFENDEGERLSRVLLVAAHRDMVISLVEAATEAGVKPIGVDLNPFAVLRCVGDASVLDQGSQVVLDVGAAVTSIVVHQGRVPTFVRILVMGGDDITSALVEGLSIPRDEADTRKREQAVGETQDVAGRIVTEGADRFVNEIRSSLDYYRAQMGAAAQLADVVLTGGGSGLAGLPERLASAVGLPVAIGSPFDTYPAEGTVYGPDDLARVGPSLSTAVGLALGGLE